MGCHPTLLRQKRAVGVSGLVLLLAACSSSGSGLTTGSLLPGTKAKQAADPATERAMQVAATAARAAKCGYNFDPIRLKTSYLAYEFDAGRRR